ncbi:MAG: hypothetical protein ACOZNI_14735 [Myxococcota bacterium]
MRRQRSVRWRQLAVLVATLLSVVLAQVGVQIHEAATPHVVCAEHDGRVEDGPVQVASAERHDVASLSAMIDLGDDHEGCAMPLTPKSGSVDVADAAPAWEAVAGVLADDPLPEGVPGRTGPPLLHVAPKLSPPRA